MAKILPEKFIDNQNILKETAACGGSNGLKKKYIQIGQQLQHNKDAKIQNLILMVCGWLLADSLSQRFSNLKNKRKEKQNKKQT